MTAFAGVFHRREVHPITPRLEAEAMLPGLARGAGDGAAIVASARHALANVVSRVTPGSPVGSLPHRDAARGLSIAADARLDDRDALARSVERDPAESTDGELLLAAWERWGESFPERILGEFAVAIFDEREGRLFCARDPMGVRPLYYHVSPEGVAFATELRALLSLDWIPDAVDEAHVADIFANPLTKSDSTGFRALRKLPPGHSMRVDSRSFRARRYYAVELPERLRLSRDAEYAERLRDALERAVARRTVPGVRVGATLSGGLDSSSICCLAARILAREGRPPLHAFTCAFRERASSDESGFAEHVARLPGIEGAEVAVHARSPIALLEDFTERSMDLAYAPNLFLYHAMYEAAEARGVRIVHDGFDGDTVIGHGIARLGELAGRLRWLALWREVDALARRLGVSRARLLRDRALRPLLSRGAAAVGRRPAATSHWADAEVLAPGLLERSGAFARWSAEAEEARSLRHAGARSDHLRKLHMGTLVRAFETIDVVGSLHGVRPSFPFLDRDLVELSLSYPTEQKLRGGWTRWVLRQAMAGVLPDEVRWRPGKSNLGGALLDRLLEHDAARILDVIEGAPSELWSLLSEGRVRSALSKLSKYVRMEAVPPRVLQTDTLIVWQAASLAVWLSKREAWRARRASRPKVAAE